MWLWLVARVVKKVDWPEDRNSENGQRRKTTRVNRFSIELIAELVANIQISKLKPNKNHRNRDSNLKT